MLMAFLLLQKCTLMRLARPFTTIPVDVGKGGVDTEAGGLGVFSEVHCRKLSAPGASVRHTPVIVT